MSEYSDNYKTDEKNVHWVKMDYVNPIMKKDELAMDKLTAENALLTEKLKESDQREIELINRISKFIKESGFSFSETMSKAVTERFIKMGGRHQLTTNRGEE